MDAIITYGLAAFTRVLYNQQTFSVYNRDYLLINLLFND